MIPSQLQSMHLHYVNSDIQFEALAFVRARFHHSSILVVVENSRSVFHNGANRQYKISEYLGSELLLVLTALTGIFVWNFLKFHYSHD